MSPVTGGLTLSTSCRKQCNKIWVIPLPRTSLWVVCLLHKVVQLLCLVTIIILFPIIINVFLFFMFFIQLMCLKACHHLWIHLSMLDASSFSIAGVLSALNAPHLEQTQCFLLITSFL